MDRLNETEPNQVTVCHKLYEEHHDTWNKIDVIEKKCYRGKH